MKIKSLLLLSLATLLTFNAFAMEEGIVRSGQKRSADTASDGQENKRQRAEGTAGSAEQEQTITLGAGKIGTYMTEEDAQSMELTENGLKTLSELFPREMQDHIAKYILSKNQNQTGVTVLDKSKYSSSCFHTIFHPDGQRIIGLYSRKYFGSSFGKLHVWSGYKTSKYKTKLVSTPFKKINHIVLNDDGTKIAVQSGRQIAILDASKDKGKYEKICQINLPTEKVKIGFLKKDPQTLITVTEKGTVTFWNSNTGIVIKSIKIIKNYNFNYDLNSYIISQDGTKLAEQRNYPKGNKRIKSSVTIWNTETGAKIHHNLFKSKGCIISISPDGEYYALFSSPIPNKKHSLYVINSKNNEIIELFSSDDKYKNCRCGAFNSDSSKFAFYRNRKIEIYNIPKGSFSHSLPANGFSDELTFAPDNSFIASTNYKKSVVLYNPSYAKSSELPEIRQNLTINQALLLQSIAQAKAQDKKFKLSDDGEEIFDTLDDKIKGDLEQWVARPEEVKDAIIENIAQKDVARIKKEQDRLKQNVALLEQTVAVAKVKRRRMEQVLKRLAYEHFLMQQQKLRMIGQYKTYKSQLLNKLKIAKFHGFSTRLSQLEENIFASLPAEERQQYEALIIRPEERYMTDLLQCSSTDNLTLHAKKQDELRQKIQHKKESETLETIEQWVDAGAHKLTPDEKTTFNSLTPDEQRRLLTDNTTKTLMADEVFEPGRLMLQQKMQGHKK